MNLSEVMKQTLTELYTEVDGTPDVAIQAARRVHHKTVKALARRGLITFAYVRRSPTHWYDVTLTVAGKRVAEGLGTSTSGTSTSNDDSRRRVPVRFNFDLGKREQGRAYRYTERLKQERRFTPMLTKALRLIEDLERGNVDVLLREYAHLVPALADEICEVPAVPVQFQQMLQAIADKVDRIGAQPRQDHDKQVPLRQPSAAVDTVTVTEDDSIDNETIVNNVMNSLNF